MLKPSVQIHNMDGILLAEFWDCLRIISRVMTEGEAQRFDAMDAVKGVLNTIPTHTPKESGARKLCTNDAHYQSELAPAYFTLSLTVVVQMPLMYKKARRCSPTSSQLRQNCYPMTCSHRQLIRAYAG